MKHIYYTTFLFFIVALIACVKKDDYKKHLKGGERVYPAKPDSIAAHPGNERIMLSWVLAGDPNLTSYKIFWNRGLDSTEYILTRRSSTADTIRVVIDSGVEEGIHTFSIYAFDNIGNRSNPAEKTAKTYGEDYQNQLNGNRKIAAVQNYSDTLVITWKEAPVDNIITELNYTTLDNSEQQIRVSPDSLLTRIPDYKFSSDILYRSGFIPEENAIDTFFIPLYDTLRYVP